MIHKGDGYFVTRRDVHKQGSVTTPVEFFVFMPIEMGRGQTQLQVLLLVLEKGELVPVQGKLSKATDVAIAHAIPHD